MVDLKLQFPEDWFEEEECCGFMVSRKRKEVWAVELDLLNQLLEVCRKNGIKIYASGGTLLGAVRHKGFIPWDDDIDMMMFREDYDKLCKVADSEFVYPYFFQNEYTDTGSMRGHAQLRNSVTTGILNGELPYKYKFNQGIFIDIMILDAVIDDKKMYFKQKKRAERYKSYAFKFANVSTRYFDDGSGSMKQKIKLFLSEHFYKTFRYLEIRSFKKFEDICKKYNGVNTELISTLSLVFCEKHFKSRSDFFESVEMPFEFITIPVCKNYDHALRRLYGNYMKIIKESNNHGDVLFDSDSPYIYYIMK